jgi:DNA-binding PadR family transcriptional regulator
MHTNAFEEFLPLSPQSVHVLTAFALGPHSAYDIMRRVGEDSGGLINMSPGSVYPLLRRLDRSGYIELIEEIPNYKDGRMQRTYGITDLGRWLLDMEIDRLERLAKLANDRKSPKRAKAGPAANAADWLAI